MKVALVTRFPANPLAPSGGVESVSVTLVQALGNLDGLDLHVVTTTPGRTDSSIESWDGVRIHRLPQSGRILPFAVGRGRKQVKEYLGRLAPDIVHAHDVYGLMVKGLSIPRVFTIHGFIHADTLVSGRRFSLLRSKVWKAAETAGWADQRNIISISPYVRERLRGIFAGRIYDIDNPVPQRFFQIQRAEQKGRIFSAAWISPRKNTLSLVKAFACLLESGTNAELRLAGAAHEQSYMEKVRQFIKEHKLEDHVKLLGSIDRAAICAELAAASDFVLASLEENSPMGIEEAMAAGLPIVTSNRCGMPYMVRDGQSGYLIDPTDPQDIASSLRQLLADDDLRRAMGTKSRQIAEDRFRPDIVARQTYRSYVRASGDHQREDSSDKRSG